MARGLYQKDVARKIGAWTETIRNWELGHPEPALRYGPAIIEFLGFVPFEFGDSLGERIRGWRRIHGVPRSAPANRLGVDESTVGRWEAGETEPLPAVRDELEALLSSLPAQEHK